MKKRCLMGALALAAVLIPAGCGGGTAAVQIGDDVTRVDVVHHRCGEIAQWAAEGEDVGRLREWVSQLESKRCRFEEGDTPGDRDGGECFVFAPTEGDAPEFCYVDNGEGDCYLLVEDNWYAVLNPTAPPVQKPEAEKLTLEKVMELAEKGDTLTWGDFEQYACEDIGFGLYILRYPIGERYYLMIGGVPGEPPMYIRLASAEDGGYIDIRTACVEDFINR